MKEVEVGIAVHHTPVSEKEFVSELSKIEKLKTSSFAVVDSPRRTRSSERA